MKTILHTESSLGFGGQEIRILEESKELQKRGYTIIILCQPNSGIAKKSKEQGFVVEEIRMGHALSPRAILAIIKVMKKYNIEILNTHSSKDSWLASIAGRIMKKPVIRTRHVSIPVRRNFFSEFVYKYLCDIIITTGEALKNSLIVKNKIPPPKIVSIPTGIDLNKFKKILPDQNVKQEFNIAKDDFVVGMMGFIRSEKGHKYFLQAVPEILKQLPNTKFLIIGSEPMGSMITDMVLHSDLRFNVTITGFREDVVSIASIIDILVQPSTGKEGVPQSLMQGLAMEKACIATKVGAIEELIIDNKTGLFIPLRNAQAIAEKTVFLLTNPVLREELGKQGRKLVEEKFAINKMSDKIDKIYSSF